METTSGKIHRRKSSKDDDEITLVVNTTVNEPSSPLSASISPTPTRPAPPPPRSPRSPLPIPALPSASLRSPIHARVPTSPIPVPPREYSHAQRSRVHSTPAPPPTRSISTPYSPPLPSPLSFSFPADAQSRPTPPRSPTTTKRMSALSASSSLPENRNTLSPSSSLGDATGQEVAKPGQGQESHLDSKQHNRRHSRLHSRNLSIFFPRPEDGAQELEFPSSYSDVDVEALPMPSAANFTFGGRPGRPPALSGPTTVPTPPLMSNGPSSASSTSSRRGHHHKHSLSHNFFSFLEPGAGGLPSAGAGVGVEQEQELYTQPTPTPMSPWNPISPFPKSAGMAPGSAGHAHAHSHSHVNTNADIQSYNSTLPTSPLALPFTIIQFFLGAFLWVSGQQIGSLGTTGLGYWVVFDSLGVCVGRVLGSWLREGSVESGTSSGNGRSALRRPYGNARIETVLQFAQSVYLMFSSVYVCKETVEHVLLSAGSAGGGDGHHHHAGDEDPNGHLGIQFPYILAFISFVTITMSAMMFDNHKKLVESDSHHRTFDLFLAGIITFVTFRVSYSASVVLGTVLLQTAPRRITEGRVGRMEAFLRAMKDVERHPQVLHLPAPHIWQFTPTPAVLSGSSDNTYNAKSFTTTSPTPEHLVVTLELHVRRDLSDEDVLKLTRWAWEKCVGALTGGVGPNVGVRGEMVKADVTVGVVRG
ncbi:hypothetical protein EV359DRAFT_74998 [Lentinula novae-zelandiae]|nr:hypothetical protein EV359DRAFT_74998 [Lentinula novae-zelandiae]